MLEPVVLIGFKSYADPVQNFMNQIASGDPCVIHKSSFIEGRPSEWFTLFFTSFDLWLKQIGSTFEPEAFTAPVAGLFSKEYIDRPQLYIGMQFISEGECMVSKYSGWFEIRSFRRARKESSNPPGTPVLPLYLLKQAVTLYKKSDKPWCDIGWKPSPEPCPISIEIQRWILLESNVLYFREDTGTVECKLEEWKSFWK
jgi:hypothetical protein